jgi:predicted N-acyltransferase
MPANDSDLKLRVSGSLEHVSPEQWNACVGAGEPFQEYEFLRALEQSATVGEGTGWLPQYVTLERDGRVLGALPLYVKTDSYGEFIFDWAWADAYRRADVPYYPKAVSAIPFTPVTGSRLLLSSELSFDTGASMLANAALQLAQRAGLSGLHFLFSTEREARFLEAMGFLRRLTYQFHWLNRDYSKFDDFAADLRASKRKNILKERRRVVESGVRVRVVEGDDVREEHMRELWRFYHDTIGRKWSYAYLTQDCFVRLGETFRHRLVLVLAEANGETVGGTLNVRKGPNLYGRYWGCTRSVPGLHFECCYYRLIDYAIATGVRLFEAGAQGEHKFLRGFVTRPTHSVHWLAHPGGRAAIESFLAEERVRVSAAIDEYNGLSPLKYLRAGSG